MTVHGIWLDWRKSLRNFWRESVQPVEALVTKTVQFLEGTVSWLPRAAVGKNTLMLGGWPAGHLCAVSELSGLAHENYTIFMVRNQSTIGRAG